MIERPPTPREGVLDVAIIKAAVLSANEASARAEALVIEVRAIISESLNRQLGLESEQRRQKQRLDDHVADHRVSHIRPMWIAALSTAALAVCASTVTVLWWAFR